MDTSEKIYEWTQIFLERIKERTLEAHVAYDEGYKFKSVDHFLAHFDINAEDIASNLDESILNNNLVTAAMYFPRKMLLIYANRYPEETRQILKTLFDESIDVHKRIDGAETAFKLLEDRRANEDGHEPANTYITLRFISLLLGYMHPNKYNPLKPAEWKVFARFINPNFTMPHHTSSGEQYRIYSEYIEPLRHYIEHHSEFLNIRDALTHGLHVNDSAFRWVTQDVIFVTARHYADQEAQKKLGEQPITDIETEELIAVDEQDTGFMALEKHLEEYVIKNWHNIDFGEKIEIYSDREGSTGQQYTTDVGVIDILAKDDHGNYVVIELKRAREGYKVVGQILNYIGWVKTNLATDGESVRGIIIVGQADKTLRSAIEPISDLISLKEYHVQLSLSDTA